MTLSKLCSSPHQELLEQAGCVGTGWYRAQPLLQGGRLVEPIRGLGSRAGRWLGHQREAHGFRERQRLRRIVDQLVTRARNPGGLQNGFHPRLVPDVAGDVDVHALQAEHLPGLGHRHLQLLKSADQPLHPAHLLAQPGYRLSDLLRVQRVVHPPVAGQEFLQPSRELIGRRRSDDSEPDARQFRRRDDEPGSGFEQERCDESCDNHALTVPAGG